MPFDFGVTNIAPDELLKALQRQLSESGTPRGSNQPGAGLADRGFLSLFEDSLHLANPVATQFAAVKPTNWPVWQSVVDAVGRDYTGFNASVTIACFCQISSDPEMKNTNAISETTLGVTSFVMKVVSAVQFWIPKNSDGDDMLREPARVATSGLRYTQVNGKGGPWIKIAFDFEMKFSAKLPVLG